MNQNTVTLNIREGLSLRAFRINDNKGPYFAVVEVDEKVIWPRKKKIAPKTPGKQAEIGRPNVRQAVIDMRLGRKSADRAEIRFMKATGMLGSRAPSCTLLSAEDMIKLLKKYGKEEEAQGLAAAVVGLRNGTIATNTNTKLSSFSNSSSDIMAESQSTEARLEVKSSSTAPLTSASSILEDFSLPYVPASRRREREWSESEDEQQDLEPLQSKQKRPRSLPLHQHQSQSRDLPSPHSSSSSASSPCPMSDSESDAAPSVEVHLHFDLRPLLLLAELSPAPMSVSFLHERKLSASPLRLPISQPKDKWLSLTDLPDAAPLLSPSGLSSSSSSSSSSPSSSTTASSSSSSACAFAFANAKRGPRPPTVVPVPAC